jgi:hypothetical protein
MIMTQVLTGATVGPVIVPVCGPGLERRELQGRSALSLTLTVGSFTAVAPCRFGWLPNPCNFGGGKVTLLS